MYAEKEIMELRHLRYFVAVAEELSFRRAAQRLFMEQPPLSRQIQQLEEEIGVLLLARVKRHIELTAAGQVFLDEARQTLARADHAIHAAQQASRGQVQSLAVGFCACLDKFSYDFALTLPEVVQTFRRQRPDISITLVEIGSLRQVEALSERTLDVGFIQVSAQDEALVSHLLSQEPLVIALPHGHPLAALPSLPLGALAGEKFLLFPAHVYPAMHQRMLAACAQAGFRPHVVQEVVSSQMAVGLVGAGMGVTFAGASMAGTEQPGVVFRAVQDFPFTLELSVAWRRDNASSALAEFVDLARKMF